MTSTPPDPGPITTLRGAGVAVDPRRAARVAVVLALAALAAVTVVLAVAGAQKNAQINELRNNGVTIDMTVTRCSGLLGGSGSNAAGYACQGTYSFHGHRYTEAIPGNVLRIPGSRVRAVIAPSDPGLVSTASAVRTDQPSLRVFLAPLILGVVTVVATALAWRARRRGTKTRDSVDVAVVRREERALPLR